MSTVSSGTHRSNDNGDTWSRIPYTNVHGKIALWPETILLTHSGAMFASGAGVLDMGTIIYRSLDDGANWYSVLETDREITHIGALGETPDGRVWASGNSYCMMSEDMGDTWQSDGLWDMSYLLGTPDGKLAGVADLNANRPGSYHGVHIFDPRSDSRTQYLNGQDACALAVHPDGTLFVATNDAGIFRSTFSVPVKLSQFLAD